MSKRVTTTAVWGRRRFIRIAMMVGVVALLGSHADTALGSTITLHSPEPPPEAWSSWPLTASGELDEINEQNSDEAVHVGIERIERCPSTYGAAHSLFNRPLWEELTESEKEVIGEPTFEGGAPFEFVYQSPFLGVGAYSFCGYVTNEKGATTSSTEAQITVAPSEEEPVKVTGPQNAVIMTACGLLGPKEHPAQIAFSCDGNTVFSDLRWLEWGGLRAIADGTAALKDGCTPDCARAPVYRYSARIVATQPLYCGSKRIYSEVEAILSEPDFSGAERLRAPVRGCPSVKHGYRSVPSRESEVLVRALQLQRGCRAGWVRISRLDPRFAAVSLVGRCPEDVVALFSRAEPSLRRFGSWHVLPGDPANLQGDCELMPADVIAGLYGDALGKRSIDCDAPTIQTGFGLAFDPSSILIGTPSFVLDRLTDILWTEWSGEALLGSAIESGPGERPRDVRLRAYAPSPRCHGISHYTRLRVTTLSGHRLGTDLWERGCEAR